MSNNPNQNNEKITVYYDGSCPMCSAFMDKIDDSSRKNEFSLKNIAENSLPENFTKEQVEKEIHVIDSKGNIHKNAEGVLKMLEEYPRWKFLARVGRLPLIKQLLTVGYKFVAANRHFIFGPASRIFWLKVTVISGLIAGLLLSMKLWAGNERIFPLIPVMDNFLTVPSSIETILYVVLLSLLAAIAIYQRPQKLIFSSLMIMCFYAFFDQMRWRPWLYQYFFMLAALSFYSWNYTDTRKRQAVLNTCRLIVASIYFFSGLQKVNIAFMSEVFPWMIWPIANLFPPSFQSIFLLFGVIVPFLEIGIGIGLLTKKFRKYAIILALLMSGFVLLTLGPLGHNWNSIVWPWNIVMGLLVVILFWRTEMSSLRDIFWPKNYMYQRVVLLLFCIMPVFSFFNFWDSYLSSTLYSGNKNKARIYVSDTVKQELPAEIRSYVSRNKNDKSELVFDDWSLGELNVPTYPEARIYKDVASYICEYGKSNVELVVRGKPTMFNAEDESTYKCSDL